LKIQPLWLKKEKSYIVSFIHVKSIKVTSGFNLLRMKKIRQMALTCRKIKNKSYNSCISTIVATPGIPGVSKDAPGPSKL
jgi:hypothetical protein